MAKHENTIQSHCLGNNRKIFDISLYATPNIVQLHTHKKIWFFIVKSILRFYFYKFKLFV